MRDIPPQYNTAELTWLDIINIIVVVVTEYFMPTPKRNPFNQSISQVCMECFIDF